MFEVWQARTPARAPLPTSVPPRTSSCSLNSTCGKTRPVFSALGVTAACILLSARWPGRESVPRDVHDRRVAFRSRAGPAGSSQSDRRGPSPSPALCSPSAVCRMAGVGGRILVSRRFQGKVPLGYCGSTFTRRVGRLPTTHVTALPAPRGSSAGAPCPAPFMTPRTQLPCPACAYIGFLSSGLCTPQGPESGNRSGNRKGKHGSRGSPLCRPGPARAAWERALRPRAWNAGQSHLLLRSSPGARVDR